MFLKIHMHDIHQPVYFLRINAKIFLRNKHMFQFQLHFVRSWLEVSANVGSDIDKKLLIALGFRFERSKLIKLERSLLRLFPARHESMKIVI